MSSIHEEIHSAMRKYHDRNHGILGAMLVYLHAKTDDPAGRAALVNHAVDAAFNIAMMTCEVKDRAQLKQEIIRRVSELDETKYPSQEQLLKEDAINGLFRTGLMRMASDKELMTCLGALLLAGEKPDVNDKLH